MKYKMIFIVTIVMIFMSFSQKIYAFEEVESDSVEKNNEIEPSSITDPEQDIDDGATWVTVTYVFIGAKYDSVFANTYNMPCGINQPVQQLDSELLVLKGYEFSHWVDGTGEIWDFENDLVTENMSLYAMWNHIPSYYLESIDANHNSSMNVFFSNIYYDPQFNMISTFSTKNVTNGEPINLCSTDDPLWADELENARTDADAIDYGGCGPIAMISVMDYFSHVLGYKAIENDTRTSEGMQSLATNVYDEVNTIAFGSTGNKNVGTVPSEYVRAFNALMANFELSEKISANYLTGYYTFNGKLDLIKNSVNNGLPVTCYTIFSEGEVGSHYINIYGYEEWEVNVNGNKIIHTFLKIRPNNSGGSTKNYYLDCRFLESFNVGLIYYTIDSYDYSEEINGEDFSRYFISDGTNYVLDSNYIEIHNTEGYNFNVKRIYTATINNELTSSVNVNNNKNAGLYLKFFENIKMLSLDFSVYSSEQNFIENTSLEIKYYDDESEQWITPYVYRLSEFSNELDNITVYFPYGIKEFDIRILSNNSMTSTVLSSVKIERIIVSFNLNEQHYHSYTYTRTSIKHTASCSCGETFTESHTFKTNLVMGQLIKSCTECGYVVKNDDFILASIEEEFDILQ